MKTNTFDFLKQQFEDHLPEQLKPLNAELHEAGRKMARSTLEQLALVSREEYEQQVREFQELKATLAHMEARLAELERRQANGRAG